MNCIKNNLTVILIACSVLLVNSGYAQNKEIPQASYPAANGLHGKVFAGYQGWYRTPTDGSGLGWEHYEDPAEKFTPGKAGIDYWPAEAELTKSEKYATSFKHADGSPAYVYTAQNEQTVDRHFKWMAEYGIDGVFLQRFAVDVVGFHHQSNLLKPSNNKVLKNVQKGANHHKRAFAIMYDLSGMPHGEMQRVIDDWKELNKQQHLREDPAYLKDGGKPVIAIWGVGFSDGRKYTLDEVKTLIDFFHNDPEFGGCSVLLGVPAYWRSLDRDAVNDPKLHEVIASADIILPWLVGRYGGAETALRMEKELFAPDYQWCVERNLQYMPVVFPGFSWGNRYKHKNAKYDHIPREDGRFLWSQAVAAKRGGADMLYIAMFDEMDEGTQIFKISNDPPIGASPFLSYKPHAPDYYLRLSGVIGKLMRDEIPASNALPKKF